LWGDSETERQFSSWLFRHEARALAGESRRVTGGRRGTVRVTVTVDSGGVTVTVDSSADSGGGSDSFPDAEPEPETEPASESDTVRVGCRC
jgi:hypothetical protein